MALQGKKTLAYALSGGAARAIAHIGVLQVLDGAGIRPDYIAGTSGGDIMGALYLDGMPLEKMAELAAKMRWRDILAIGGRTGLIGSDGIYRFIKRNISRPRT